VSARRAVRGGQGTRVAGVGTLDTPYAPRFIAESSWRTDRYRVELVEAVGEPSPKALVRADAPSRRIRAGG
jgi:hypothetical protein